MPQNFGQLEIDSILLCGFHILVAELEGTTKGLSVQAEKMDLFKLCLLEVFDRNSEWA